MSHLKMEEFFRNVLEVSKDKPEVAVILITIGFAVAFFRNFKMVVLLSVFCYGLFYSEKVYQGYERVVAKISEKMR